MIPIRKATIADAEVIARYQVFMADETEGMKLDYEVVLRGVSSAMKDSWKGFYLVSEIDEKIVGCLMVTLEWSDWRAKIIFWIQSLYVEPEFRRRGIFKAMYSYLKQEIAVRDDVAGIRLYVDKSNVRAQDVYNALGMNGEHYQLFEDID